MAILAIFVIYSLSYSYYTKSHNYFVPTLKFIYSNNLKFFEKKNIFQI